MIEMPNEQTQLEVGPPAVLRVEDDYGPVGKGVSNAHCVIAENGQEYIVKSPCFAPDHPHVAANEYIAARLANAIGLPILDFRILEMAGHPLFASGWMDKGTFCPQTTRELFAKCQNRDRVYDLVVFDCWINNTDRHQENLLVREIRPRGAAEPRHTLLCNDHSHCLVRPKKAATELASQLDAPPVSHPNLAFVTEAVTQSARLADALRTAASVPDDTIKAAFSEMPVAFLPSAQDGKLMCEYLLERRDRLADIFRAHRATFNRLDGGPL
jgi:hypothetical protein